MIVKTNIYNLRVGKLYKSLCGGVYLSPEGKLTEKDIFLVVGKKYTENARFLVILSKDGLGQIFAGNPGYTYAFEEVEKEQALSMNV